MTSCKQPYFTLFIALAAALPALGSGPGAPILDCNAVRVEPMRVAPVQLTGYPFASANFVLSAPWTAYSPASGTCSTALVFDNFEPKPISGFPTDGKYGTSCGLPEDHCRWYFGEGYYNPFVANDLVLSDPAEFGVPADRVQFAWFQETDLAAFEEKSPAVDAHLVVMVFTAEQFNFTCASGVAPANAFYDGVAYDFGAMPSGAGVGYYWADVDLCAAGLAHTMPADGVGAYLVALTYYYCFDTGGEDICSEFLPLDGQPMLWGMQGSNPDLGGGFPAAAQWDDDNVAGDFFHTFLPPLECASYFYPTACPQPLGAMVAFYFGQNGDCNNNGVLDTSDLAMGTSQDCNGNLVPDECDIQAGTSQDCDANGVPDECDPDCNGNAVPDACELGGGIQPFLAGQSTTTLAPMTMPMSIAAADFTGDGLPDAAVLQAGADEVEILVNAGGLLLPSGSPVAIGGSMPTALATADFDGDGSADVAAVKGSSHVAVLLNAGGAAFNTAIYAIPGGDWPSCVAAGDLDNDGDPDLLVGYGGSSAAIAMLNDGSGAFPAASQLYASAAKTEAVALGDLDGDGFLDAAITSTYFDSVVLLGNNGGVSFAPLAVSAPALQPGSTPSGVAVADLDADGDTDLAVANRGTNNVVLLDNSGAATAVFAATATLAAGLGPSSILAEDLTQDGLPELIVTNEIGASASLFLNVAAAILPAAVSPIPTSAGPVEATVADFDGNGALDLAVVNQAAEDVTVVLFALVGTPGNDCNGNGVLDTCEPPCQVDLGFGGPGDLAIAVCGPPLCSGNAATFTMLNAVPNAVGTLFISLTAAPTFVPALGGTLVPLPILTSANLPTGPSGSLSLPVAGGMGPGSLYIQAIAPDAAQPKGFEVSKALRLDFWP